MTEAKEHVCYVSVRRISKQSHYYTGQCQSYKGLDVLRVRTRLSVVQRSTKVAHTFIRRTLASKRSCLTVFWAMARLLVAALLFDMTGSNPGEFERSQALFRFQQSPVVAHRAFRQGASK